VAYNCGGSLPGDAATSWGLKDCFLAPRPTPEFVYALSRARFVKVIRHGEETRMSTHIYCQPGMPLCMYLPERRARFSDLGEELSHLPPDRRYVPRGAGPYLAYLMATVRFNARALESCESTSHLVIQAIRDTYGVISGLPVRTKAHVDAVEGVMSLTHGAIRRMIRSFSQIGTLAEALRTYSASDGEVPDRQSLHMLLWYSIVHIFETLTLSMRFFPGLTAPEMKALAGLTDPVDFMAACLLSYLRSRTDLFC